MTDSFAQIRTAGLVGSGLMQLAATANPMVLMLGGATPVGANLASRRRPARGLLECAGVGIGDAQALEFLADAMEAVDVASGRAPKRQAQPPHPPTGCTKRLSSLPPSLAARALERSTPACRQRFAGPLAHHLPVRTLQHHVD